MNLINYLCAYEALYFSDFITDIKLYEDKNVIYLWNRISEFMFSEDDLMWYRSGFLSRAMQLGFKSSVRSNVGYDVDPQVSVWL